MSDTNALYAISDELLAFMANIDVDPETGEISDEDFSKIEKLHVDFDDEIQDCINYLRRTDSEAKIAKEESDKIKKYGKVLEKKVERMSNHILAQMQLMGIKKVVVSGRPASVAKNPMSVSVDKSKLSKEWFRVKVSEDPDKEAIIRHVKAKNPVPEGVVVINDKMRLNF